MAPRKAKTVEPQVDIADLVRGDDAERAFTRSLVNPYSGQATGIEVDLVVQDSRVHRRQFRRLLRQHGIGPLPEGADEHEIAEREDEMLAISAAASTTGWRGAVWNGEPYEWSLDNALALIQSVPWIGDAILAEISAKKKP